MGCAKNTVLLIDDDSRHATAFKEALRAMGASAPKLEWLRTLADGLDRVAHGSACATFLSLLLPGSRGADTLDAVLSADSACPVVVLGGVHDEEMCKAALRHGAADYLLEGHLDSYAFARALRNINEREAARQGLVANQDRAAFTLDSIGDAVLSTDIAIRVTYMNAIAEQLTGWSSEEAVGRPLTDVFQLVDGATHEAARNPLALAIELDKAVGLSPNCLLIRRDGHETAIEDSAAPIRDRDGQIIGAVIVFHDVTKARNMVLEMSHLAQHDVLTGLPNRLLLNDRLAQAIALAHRKHTHLAVLYLDVDGFKRINDSLGHAVGDLLLKSIGKSLSASVRKADTVSRQGGDEFVILLRDIAHVEDAAAKAGQLVAELRKTHTIGEHHLRVSVSIGICAYPGGGEDAATLIKNADTAMYHAKEQGRDQYQVFDEAMNNGVVERQSIEGQLRYALERGELRLHYQPKVNLETGAITGVEALVRWQHPDRGLLLPSDFLAIAEDCGMIVAIGRWALQEACRQTQEWLDAGVQAVPVSVNVSALEFRHHEFVASVQLALDTAHLNPRYLELELTETVLMRDSESTAHALEALKALGVRIAIDDFGTGYSSLSYLTRFPIDTLKLDRSFVCGITSRSDEAVVASAVIKMGKNLKHRVIAEGVETEEQLAFLQTQGCDEGQGYYFSRAVPPPEFAMLLATGMAAAVPR